MWSVRYWIHPGLYTVSFLTIDFINQRSKTFNAYSRIISELKDNLRFRNIPVPGLMTVMIIVPLSKLVLLKSNVIVIGRSKATLFPLGTLPVQNLSWSWWLLTARDTALTFCLSLSYVVILYGSNLDYADLEEHLVKWAQDQPGLLYTCLQSSSVQ